ncbi:MAG: amidase [Pseudomonadota bacterium]
MTIRRREVLKAAGGLYVASMVPPSAEPQPWYAASGDDSQPSTAVDSVRQSLGRIMARDQALQAIAWLNPQVLEDAGRIDQAASAGSAAGALTGLTVLAKSTFDVAGVATDGSNSTWARLFTAPASEDALAVARVRAAGAALLGKGAADDFAYGGAGLASATGQVWNPRYPDRERIAGGSSGGGAAAVAAGYCDAAFGTDDGGSNRIPAHYCGVVGVKTTFGLVPRSGVVPTWPWIDCHGPMATNARVAARVLSVMAGPDSSDAFSLRATGTVAYPSSWEGLADVRLGLVKAHAGLDALPATQAAAFQDALERLQAAGATIMPIDPPTTIDNLSARLQAAGASPFGTRASANALVRYLDRRPQGAAQLLPLALPAYREFYSDLPAEPEAVLAMAQTPYEESAQGLAYAERRDALVAELERFCAERKLDAMVWPTLNHEALRGGESWPSGRTPLSFVNWLGLPEVSVPVASGPDGVPRGNISFAGLPFTDFSLLALAQVFEEVRDLAPRSAGVRDRHPLG